MPAKIYNCKMEQGATFDDTMYPPWAMRDSDGEVYDLSVWTPRAQMRKTYDTAAHVAVFTCLTDLVSGQIQLYLTAAQTSAIPAGEYVYDIEIATTGDDTVRRLVQGTITVSPEATK